MIVRTIPNFTNYEISTSGVVFNVLKGRPVAINTKSKSGYKVCWLVNDEGVRKNCLLHRLLLNTFLENPNNLPCVDHIDRKRDNNHLSNLRWASYLENSRNRTASYKNKLGKCIFGDEKRYRVVIYTEGKRVYDKSFLKVKFDLEMVKARRNQKLNFFNLPIVD